MNEGTKEIKIVIAENPVTKKNSSRIIGMGKQCPVCKKSPRQIIIPSKQYSDYEKKAGLYLAPLKIPKITYPVNVKCLYYMKTRRKVDLPNLVNATLDVLTKYEILEDDNRNVVYSTDGSRVLYSKEFPRTEIYITHINDEEVEIWGKK